MEMTLWIILCLFASIGIVQCGMWMIDALKKPDSYVRGYRVIPLYDDPECIEGQMRLIHSKTWQDDSDAVLLADMGLEEECRQICENLLIEYGGAYICDIHDISDAIISLEDGQNEYGDVK